MIKIYYCNSISTEIPTDISEYRWNKIASAKRGDERTRMINSVKTLKAGFADLGVSEKDVTYAFTENGKPYAENYPNIHFSLSHTANTSICAFYNKQIGIDCEISNRKISKEILERYFSKRECAAFSGDPLLLWVAKEALVKYTGKGFASGRKEYEIPYFESKMSLYGIWLKKLDIEGCTVVICTEKGDEIQIKKVP